MLISFLLHCSCAIVCWLPSVFERMLDIFPYHIVLAGGVIGMIASRVIYDTVLRPFVNLVMDTRWAH